MSIVTRTGDAGETALMYGRRVPKSHPRVRAYGEVDELTALLGMARASTRNQFLLANLEAIQKELIVLMGELATAIEDLPRFVKDGFRLVGPEMTATLDQLVREIEARQITFRGTTRTCGSCHADVHDGQFQTASESKPDCGRCHTTTNWRPTGFDHQKHSTFTLRGAHERVPCKMCHEKHRLAGTRQISIYRGTPRKCQGCHI